MTPSTILPPGEEGSLPTGNWHPSAGAATGGGVAVCDLAVGGPLLAVHAATSAALANAVARRSQPHTSADMRTFILHHEFPRSREQEFLASELQVTEHRLGARPKSAKREWGVAHQKAGGSSPSERANVATGQGLATGMGEALNRGRPPGGPCSQTGSLTCADQLVCRAAVKRPPALGSSKTGATPWSGPRNQASLR